VPDFNESVVHWGAGCSIHDSKIHEELYSPIPIVVSTGRPCGVGWRLRLRLPDVLTNERVIDIVGALSDLGGGEAGRLWTGKSLFVSLGTGKRTFWILVKCGDVALAKTFGRPAASASRFWISALFFILMARCSLISSSQFVALTTCSRART